MGNWMLPLASLFVAASKTSTGELDGGLLDLEASYMEMHTKERPSKQKIDWAIFDAYPAGDITLPNALTWLQNPAYGLLLQCLLPTMKKHYRVKDGQLHLYLMTEETAIKVEEERLLLFGDASTVQEIQHSLDLYQHLGQPQLAEYHVTLHIQQATIRIGDYHFQLPLS